MLDGQAHSGRQRPADRIGRASVALRSRTIRLADPGRNAVTARHHSDGEGKEHEKRSANSRATTSFRLPCWLSLMRPQVCLTAHRAPFRNGKREGRATPGTHGHSRAAPRHHSAFPRAAAQSGTKRASGLIRPTRCHRGSGRRGAAADTPVGVRRGSACPRCGRLRGPASCRGLPGQRGRRWRIPALGCPG